MSSRRTGLFLCLFLAACTARSVPRFGSPVSLASFTENRVAVEISLEVDENGQAWLAARFTPEEGLYLYAKDLPPAGINGLGRPTLLELPPGSSMQACGELMESVSARADADGAGLLIYPAGAVTLRLPVTLPDGEGWFPDHVSVTYMACRSGACYPPVLAKRVAVSVPGSAELEVP